jgi:hypothetical protein
MKDIQEKREKTMEQVLQNKRANKGDDREKRSELLNKDELKKQLLTEIKGAIQEDINQKKEISLLKKKDQMENLERGKNFHQLYKQKLVERLLEKKERAERVKMQ